MSWLGELVLKIHNWRHGVSKVAAANKKTSSPLRIGVLGAAAINPAAIFDPISTCPDAVLVGIAARNKAKAEKQIVDYRLQATRAYGSYQDLLDDGEVEAVYIPLPNGLHFEWTVKALRAGKHVLVEKPIASNAEQVRQIRQVSEETGKLVLEAFHWRFHPAAHVVKKLVEENGPANEVSARFALPAGVLSKDDIRFQYGLAGGSCMDLTYVFSATSYFAAISLVGAKIEVLDAKARKNKTDPLVDDAMIADYTVASGGNTVRCHVECDLASPWIWGVIPKFWEMTAWVKIVCEKATIKFSNFPGPYLSHDIVVTDSPSGTKTKYQAYTNGPQWKSRGERFWTTYRYQLEAFVERVRAVQSGRTLADAESLDGLPWVSLDESEGVMKIIDGVYLKCGLPVRK